MSFSFEINKLGPVRDSKVSFNRLLLFTGESNTGKSYTALLFYYFQKHISTKLSDYVKAEYNIDKIKAELNKNKNTKVNFNSDKFHNWINDTAEEYLCYLLSRNSLECDVKLNSEISSFDIIIEQIDDDISDGIKSINNFKILDNTYSADIQFPLDKAIEQLLSITLSNKLGFNNNFKTLLLPPARGALMGLNFSDKTKLADSAGMYKEFLTDYDKVSDKNIFYKKDKYINDRISKFIDGNLVSRKDGIYYKLSNEDLLPLSAVASSIKELSPIIMALQNSNINELSIMFEEPEAHLHPSLQIDIAKVISYLVNKGVFIQVTTHSDLFLTQINHLVRLDKILKKDNKLYDDIIKKIGIPKSFTLSSHLVNAYLFKKEKTGMTVIEKQDLSDGIPFDTFKKSYDKLFEVSNLIDESL